MYKEWEMEATQSMWKRIVIQKRFNVKACFIADCFYKEE